MKKNWPTNPFKTFLLESKTKKSLNRLTWKKKKKVGFDGALKEGGVKEGKAKKKWALPCPPQKRAPC